VEHKRAARFKLRAPVIFRWRDQSEARQQEKVGCTREIGISGVFVICSMVSCSLSLEKRTAHVLNLPVMSCANDSFVNLLAFPSGTR
jgi:hypothetical protein